MSEFKTITQSRSDRGVATLTLARPAKRNAIDATMIAELRTALAGIEKDGSILVVVLTAEGDTFCAGADLTLMQVLSQGDRAARLAQAGELAGLLEDMDRSSKPTICRVSGAAYGGGVGLIATCDIVIASQAARFALTEVRLGLIPATIGPFVVRRVGEAAARRLMVSACTFDAAEAQRLGLVSVVVPPGELDKAVEREVADVLKGAPGAIAAAKAMCRDLERRTASADANATAERLANQLETDEAKAGLAAFFAGRPPPWRGRP